MKIQYVCEYCGKISFSCSEIEECEEKHLEEKLIQEEKDDRLKEIRKAIEAFESDYQEKFHCCGDKCKCKCEKDSEDSEDKNKNENKNGYLTREEYTKLLDELFSIL